MSAARAVITDIDYPDVDIEQAIFHAAGIALEVHQVKDGPRLVDLVREADGVIVQYARMTREVLSGMTRCRMVARYGVGLDTIDLAAAGELGIAVRNVPDYCTEEVADHALALMLAVLRGVHTLGNVVASGEWSLEAVRPLHRIRGLSLGLMGCGRIGTAMARRGTALGMRVLAFDPLLSDNQVRWRGASPVALEDLLRESDVLSLHRPAVLGEPPAIGAAELDRVKRGVLVVNTARGTLIDEGALRAALLDGQVGFAALDVLQTEPPVSREL
ncbi:MAG: C-terminal binding protein, partial [Chloroflexi bacterium]|nr:C-terminal binding protein [Chloroflexota bacterium]